MKRRLFTIFSGVSLLLFAVVVVLWVLGHVHAVQVSMVADDGTERAVRVTRGTLVFGTMPWSATPRDGSLRSRVRERVLEWPENASAVGLPAELGYYRDRRTFTPGHVFFSAGLSEASVLRVPLLPIVLLLGVFPAVRTMRWYGRRRDQRGQPPLSLVIPTRWKWVIAHVVASFVTVAASAIGWWSLPPPVYWLTAPVSSCFFLFVALGQPLVALVVFAAYGASLAACLWLLGVWGAPRPERQGFDVLVGAHVSNDRDIHR